MQFITNGPDIPDALLQADEDGRVVFFCGAGISYPAGLPGFKGLVGAIYRLLGTMPDAIEQDAYRNRHRRWFRRWMARANNARTIGEIASVRSGKKSSQNHSNWHRTVLPNRSLA
jgi:hypothetical protein